MTNTKSIIVTAKALKKLTKSGVVIPAPKLPAHLEIMMSNRASEMAKFDQYEVTVDLGMYSDFHPIHAML